MRIMWISGIHIYTLYFLGILWVEWGKKRSYPQVFHILWIMLCKSVDLWIRKSTDVYKLDLVEKFFP